ncbi:MAG: UDP-3-O-(3-hydroxymyristoyl)glucosamine N-acyltransferase [Arenimonas sp.]|nr:UDP-3-O-(3-hydroxymyristoyl)glucosamine N-acyltransferase [Arenimonas sp.]
MPTLKDLAERFHLPYRGDGGTVLDGIGTLVNAQAGQLAFLANGKYSQQLGQTKAGVVVLSEADAEKCPVACLISRDPYTTFAQISALFEHDEIPEEGVHASAVVHASARVSPSARIGAFTVIGERAVVEDDAVVHPHGSIGQDCVVGEACVLMPRVTLVKRVRLGKRVRIHSGAVLGADGFGIAMHQGQWIKVAQLGGVQVGDDCEIGANTTIDRGAIEDTVLENDVRLDNQIQIGHNVRIGAHTAIAGCAAVAGSAVIGRYCLIGGAAGIVGHIEIADKVIIGAMSLVSHSIREAGEYVSGTPMQAKPEWRKNAARFKQLDAMARSLNALKKKD